MNWVDVAQIISALATAGALVFVTQQTRHARNAVTEAQRMHELESARERRALEFDAQRQAAQVVAWPVKATFQGRHQWGLLVVNTSTSPVFSMSVTRAPAVSRGKGSTIAALSAKAEVLPPGQYFVGSGSRWPELMGDQDTAEPIAGNSDYMASLDFRDSNGRNWRREPSGVLAAAA
jgi:hypothetical protein